MRRRRRTGGSALVGVVVRVPATGLRETAAEHVADGQDRHVQPRLAGAKATGVAIVDDGGGDQDGDRGREEREELRRLERGFGLGAETPRCAVPVVGADFWKERADIRAGACAGTPTGAGT
jgi:hypothetical protein